MTNPIDPIADEIFRALGSGFYFLPVVLAASIPDLCAALESDDGRTNGPKYKRWFDTWLSEKMSFITADDCYSFRCGVVHQGRMGDMKNSVARVLFTLSANVRFTNCKINDAYVYSVEQFCKDMVDAANKWYAQKSQSPNVQRNAAKIMRVHPNGLEPYIVGIPVLS